jgi:hypothetical protein
MSADLYEENLWGKIDYLHERYNREHNHISNFLDMMSKYQLACFEFSKQITNILNKNYILSESNTSTLYRSMQNYYKVLLIHSNAFKETFESIKINLMPVTKSISDSFQKEKEMYNSYVKTRTIYINNKTNLEKIKKEFNQKSKDCETLVYNAKKAKIFSTATPEQINKMENKASENLANTALFEDKYVQALNEANKSRENEINSQKKLQSYYHNIDTDYYGKIRMMTGFFISCLKRMFSTISVEIDDLNETFNKINIEQDINDFVEKFKTNAKPDSIIKYVPYKPAPEIVSNSIINSNANDKKNLIVSYEVIVVFKKLFKFIRTDLDMEEEKKKNRFRILTYKIFSQADNVSFTQKELSEILLLLKQKTYRSYILTILAKSRTKVFKKSEKLINDLAEIINYILDLEEKEKELNMALACITLGETFYYEKINKFSNKTEKKYLIEGIKENKWVSTIEFWNGIINLMIQKEVEKSSDIKNNEKDKKKVFNQIVYTQIFTYSNNMLEYNINKNDICTLVENLSNKYQLQKEDYDKIINNINKKDIIIEKNEKKIKEKKKEENEDKKENKEEDEKKEDNKEEDKKDKIIENDEKEEKNDDEIKNEELKEEDKKVEEEKVEKENKEEKEIGENNEEKEEEKNENEKEKNDKEEEKKEKEEVKNGNNNEEDDKDGKENEEEKIKKEEEKEEVSE